MLDRRQNPSATMNITTSSAVTAALASIQGNQSIQDRNLQRLTTGRSVNSLSDNATAFSLAQGLTERASALSEVGSNIGQGIGALQAASNGIDAISSVVKQLKGLAVLAQASTDPAQQASLQSQYNTLAGQIDSLAANASYNGINLIAANPGSLTIPGASSTTITGAAADSASLGVITASGWSGSTAAIQANIDALDQATRTLRNQAADLGGNTASLQITASFVQSQATNAARGADKLTSSDANEAAANAQAANTYRQLGIAALRNANQSQEAVLGIFSRRQVLPTSTT